MLVTQMVMQTTADLQSQTTSWEHNNANTVGNAEELVIAKEEDGALDMMDVSEPLYQLKHQDYYPITEWIQLLIYLRYTCFSKTLKYSIIVNILIILN